ncbi:Phosphatidylinositol-4-phosphate 5-kinase [Serendipita sp. 400]|nr:Phosphatidylinositol-4-phosphate 5-kinase [Serendipita sp. 400]
MATTLVPTTSIERERERDLPASSMQNTNHPPSSFDPSRIPSRSGSVAEPGMGHTAASSSNIANVLNTRPVYDRSTSQLGRYDSKRSSMISNSSFQTAPLVGGSNYGGASVYGTADGGTPRDSIDTVQGYEPPSTPGIPAGAYMNGHVDNGHLSPQFLQPYPQPTNATSSTSDQRPGTAGSKASSIKSSGSNPGNDLPKHLATGPSPVDIESGHLKPVASNIMPSTPPRGNIILDTSVLSASPSHSPSVGEPVDAIHSAVDRAGKGTTSSNPESRGVPNGDALSDDGTVSENAPTLRGPKAQTTHPYPLSSLLHPFSALGATQNAATNNVAVTTDTSTADDTEPTPPRPIRRNTTGSTNLVSKSKSQANTAAASTTGITAWDSGLDEDMKKQAEQIRRERKRREEEAEEQEKFAKEKKESKGKERGRDRTGQHARSGSAGGRSLGARSIGNKSMEEWKPVVGNVVGEGHVNYILMYNMLTGIRVAVSRCQAKPPRTLTDEDFTAAHKYNFDVIGNELTPSAKYDFKFKDYAPWVFRSLREDSFNLDPADYLLSLTSKYILSELGSPGKSGSFFYYSRDYRFIIKTIRHIEHKWLRRVLKDYYRHVKDNPHTLISRFYGLHRVKLPRGKKIHFVIMNNLFPAHRDIHETYDLKGSTVGRLLPAIKVEENPGAVMKDMNWIDRGRALEFGPYKRALLTEQLRRDVEFLKSIGVMDYSLLVGIHSVKRGNKENIRSNTLKVFKPDIKDVPDLDAAPGARRWIGIKHAMEVRRAILVAQRQHLSTIASEQGNPTTSQTRERTSRDKGYSKDRSIPKPSPLHTLESSNLPEEDPLPSDRSGFIFYSDDGGYRATDDLDREWRGGPGGKTVVNGKIVDDEEAVEKADGEGVVYYLGVIDILTRWTLTKKAEHVYKGLKADKHKISPVNPNEYGDRFFSFLQAIMRGGEGPDKFV